METLRGRELRAARERLGFEREVRFAAHVNATVEEIVNLRHRPLTNLYAYKPAGVMEESAVATAVEQALAREPSVFDSHPSPKDRFRWVEALHAQGEPAAASDPGAWSLFSDREHLEREMTAIVRENPKPSSGIELAG